MDTIEKQYFSILFPERFDSLDAVQPQFFSDLQLEGILKAILSRYNEFDLKKYFYTLPDNEQTVRYRQAIYQDLEHNPAMVMAMKKYTHLLLESENSYRCFQQADDHIIKGSFLLITCRNYIQALELLKQTLDGAELSSEGFLALESLLATLYQDEGFLSFAESVRAAFAQLETLKLTLFVKDRELSILEQEETNEKQESMIAKIRHFYPLLDISLPDDGETREEVVRNIFPSVLKTSALENTIVEILKKNTPETFALLRQFSQNKFSINDNLFYLLKNEIVFYISFYEFEASLRSVGYTLEYPQINDSYSLEICQVYDVALAWKNRFSEQNIVPNDISYQVGKSFLVVTGPNQGGKTTLARAIGQSVYFMRVGLKVPCTGMKTRFFQNLFTHFEVEESVKTGAGKLKEELQRLKPMMLYIDKEKTKNCFVILNELFTTATTYDAQIMAQKVMKHFSHNQCLGIYVTHIRELADEGSQAAVQSMVAQVDEENPAVRTYKIIPMEAMGMGYSDSIVKKYGLDYEQVTERISHQ